jgi:hypothetical protein
VRDVKRASLLEEMLAAFPEWQASYDDLLDYGGGRRSAEWPGLHNPFMIAFLPDLPLPLLSATDGGDPVVPTVVLDLPPRGSTEAEAILDRVFAFIDRMAVSRTRRSSRS